MRRSLENAFAQVQTARTGIYQNLRLPVLGGAFGALGGLMARLNPIGSAPNDRLGHLAAATLLRPGEQRNRITTNLHLPSDQHSALGRLEHALQLCTDAEPIIKTLKDAVKAGRLPKARPAQLLDQPPSKASSPATNANWYKQPRRHERRQSRSTASRWRSISTKLLRPSRRRKPTTRCTKQATSLLLRVFDAGGPHGERYEVAREYAA